MENFAFVEGNCFYKKTTASTVYAAVFF